MASTVVRWFMRLWPGISEAAARQPPGTAETAELRRLAARCAMLAMQASAADFLPGLPDLADSAAAAFPLPGGESFSLSLAVALQLYSSQQGSLAAVVAALARIAALPDVVALRYWAAGDRNPDLALVRPHPPPLPLCVAILQSRRLYAPHHRCRTWRCSLGYLCIGLFLASAF